MAVGRQRKQAGFSLVLALVSLGLLALAIVFWRQPSSVYTWAGWDWSIVALDLSIVLFIVAALTWPRSN
jgi:hypothetical protein